MPLLIRLRVWTRPQEQRNETVFWYKHIITDSLKLLSKLFPASCIPACLLGKYREDSPRGDIVIRKLERARKMLDDVTEDFSSQCKQKRKLYRVGRKLEVSLIRWSIIYDLFLVIPCLSRETIQMKIFHWLGDFHTFFLRTVYIHIHQERSFFI